MCAWREQYDKVPECDRFGTVSLSIGTDLLLVRVRLLGRGDSFLFLLAHTHTHTQSLLNNKLLLLAHLILRVDTSLI